MKHRLLLVLIITFFTRSFSQEKSISFYVSAGPTLSVPKTSKLTSSNIDGSPEIKSLINIGVFILPSINYAFNEKVSLDFGLGFYLDRFSIEDKIGPVINKGNRAISQIQIPININYHFGKNRSFIFGVGAFSSFLVSVKEKGKTSIAFNDLEIVDPGNNFLSSSEKSYSINLKENYNSLALGAYIQLKKTLSFSSNIKGFLLIKINQYINSIKSNGTQSDILSINRKEEQEPTTINLGIGILI